MKFFVLRERICESWRSYAAQSVIADMQALSRIRLCHNDDMGQGKYLAQQKECLPPIFLTVALQT
jgi:hypothetical protein